MSDDFQKGFEIGRSIGKSILREKADLPEELFDALYAEYELGVEDLMIQAKEAYEALAEEGDGQNSIEELGLVAALAGSGIDAEERQLNTYRIQELASMDDPTEEKMRALWEDGYSGHDHLIGSMLQGGALQKAFQDVVLTPDDMPETYPTLMPFAFRHFMMTASVCLPRDLLEGDNDTADFYWSQLKTGVAFIASTPTREHLAPLQEYIAYKDIQKHGQIFAHGFSDAGRSGLALLTLEFTRKAVLCKADIRGRTQRALYDAQATAQEHKIGALVQARMTGMTL